MSCPAIEAQMHTSVLSQGLFIVTFLMRPEYWHRHGLVGCTLLQLLHGIIFGLG